MSGAPARARRQFSSNSARLGRAHSSALELLHPFHPRAGLSAAASGL